MMPGRLQENSKQQSKTAVLQRLKTVIPVFSVIFNAVTVLTRKDFHDFPLMI